MSPASSDAHFGKRLRLERERRKITLDSIAANTKIGIGLLRGLERDDVSRWPSGIFRRSFIREYAAAIGVDPEETTREFLERFPDPGDITSVPVVKTSEHPVLRLTLAHVDSWLVRGRLLADLRRRWAAVALDLAACLPIGGLLFLALDHWWKGLAVTMIGYYAFSVLLLGSSPGVFLFARLPRREDGGVDDFSVPSPRVVLSRLRRHLPFAKLPGRAPLSRAAETAPQKEHLRPKSTTLPFAKTATAAPATVVIPETAGLPSLARRRGGPPRASAARERQVVRS